MIYDMWYMSCINIYIQHWNYLFQQIDTYLMISTFCKKKFCLKVKKKHKEEDGYVWGL